MKRLILAVTALIVFSAASRAEAPFTPPAEVAMDYGFSSLDESTIQAMLTQGTMLIVRQRPDLSLVNVTSAQIVNTSMETVWSVVTDFEHYPDFMPQTAAEKIIEKRGDDQLLVEQSIGVKIWRLPSVDITYQLVQQVTPPNRVRFWHASGDLEGTYGGWDLVKAGDKTMIFYTLYSNLTAMGWGLGAIFKTQPDFMAGVNVTTAMMVTKAVKEESERRAAK
jgi:ribosome-associated toxin RatA of RatAB toxin-antitoxin module